MKHTLSSELIADYVLDLLSPVERQRVEGHLVGCADCREAVLAERQIGQFVRGTVAMATRPGSTNLTCLMPTPPTTRRFPAFSFAQWRPVLAVCMLAVLFWGGLNMWSNTNPAGWQEPATAMAVTATQVPTMTATHTVEEEQEAEPTISADGMLSPVPAGTPIAAVWDISQGN